MHRDSAIDLLIKYNPVDRQELQFKTKMLEFIEAHTNCFDRELLVGHMTASAWLLNEDSSKALLMHHMKLDRWFQLGGHCDGETDLLAVAIKEAQEESGIENIVPVSTEIFDIDIHEIPARKDEPAHDHFDVRFILKVEGDEKVVQNRESKELRWIGKNKEELPTNNPSIVRMFNKWIALDL